jgi:uncharacterized protein (TIGR02117 family)
MQVRRRRRGKARLGRRLALALAAIPALYLLAALVGSLVPVNRGWSEPAQGVTIYLANNGVHADLILPAKAQGLDWAPLLPKRDFAAPDAAARWVAFGAGERRVYLDTPRWRDISLPTIWAGLTGGERVMHVEWVVDPAYAARAIRLRPEEYRRLWQSIRAEFALDADGRPLRIDHPGYGPADAFYEGRGKASAVNTCNTWAADRLRLAGVRTGLWTPFAQGLVWRYRSSSPAVAGEGDHRT